MANERTVKTPWLGRYPTLSPDDHQGLEAAAAIHEFRNGLPRDLAEARAHADYTRERALDSAAHHLLGVRAAHAAEDEDAAAQHAGAYERACRVAGVEHGGQPHEEISNRIRDARPKVYAYREHAADRLLTVPSGPTDGKGQLREALGRVKELARRLGSVKSQ